MAVSPRELVTGSADIASLPDIFFKVNEMVEDPHCSASDIGDVIKNDAAFTARLLRLVNSPFFGFPSRIDTVSRAITVIGTRELRDLILATSVVKNFAGIPADLVTMDHFWRHSIYCGLLARIIATRCREVNLERFFVAGLLHDIGSLLIYRKLPELARETLNRTNYNGQVLHQAESEVLGFNHADVGGELLRTWKLPQSLIDGVALHHTPEKALDHPREAAVTHLANIIVTAIELGHHGPVPPLQQRAWDLLGLPIDFLEPTITEADAKFADAYKMIYVENVGRKQHAG